MTYHEQAALYRKALQKIMERESGMTIPHVKELNTPGNVGCICYSCVVAREALGAPAPQPEYDEGHLPQSAVLHIINEAISKFAAEVLEQYRAAELGGLSWNLVCETGSRIKVALNLEDENGVAREPTPEAGEAKTPCGWVYKLIVNKHVTGPTGPPLDGQIQINGVWGTPSDHLHFSVEEPVNEWFWWKAPVYLASDAAQETIRLLTERVKELREAVAPYTAGFYARPDFGAFQTLVRAYINSAEETPPAACQTCGGAKIVTKHQSNITGDYVRDEPCPACSQEKRDA